MIRYAEIAKAHPKNDIFDYPDKKIKDTIYRFAIARYE